MEEEFALIDVNGGGMVLFNEFCNWAIKKGLDMENDDDTFEEGWLEKAKDEIK